MNRRFPTLFSPIQIGTVTVPNRFVVPPMGNNFANTDDSLSERSAAYYEARAKGALDALRDAPWSLRELAVGGDALMPLLTARGVPVRQMGRLLETLWRMAVEGHIQNETAALLRAADEWLSGME